MVFTHSSRVPLKVGSILEPVVPSVWNSNNPIERQPGLFLTTSKIRDILTWKNRYTWADMPYMYTMEPLGKVEDISIEIDTPASHRNWVTFDRDNTLVQYFSYEGTKVTGDITTIYETALRMFSDNDKYHDPTWVELDLLDYVVQYYNVTTYQDHYYTQITYFEEVVHHHNKLYPEDPWDKDDFEVICDTKRLQAELELKQSGKLRKKNFRIGL